MDIALWVLAIVLAVAFVGTGGSKALLDADSLRQIGSLPDHLPMRTIRLIGVAELLGAAGLIFPGWLGVAEWLTALAAAGLALNMAGAAIYHARHKEWVQLSAPIVFGALSAVLAWARFGPYPL